MQQHFDSGARPSASPFDQLLRQRQTSRDELLDGSGANGGGGGGADWLSRQRAEIFGKPENGQASAYTAYARSNQTADLHPVAIIDKPPLYERPVISPVLSTPPVGAERSTENTGATTAKMPDAPLNFGYFSQTADTSKFLSPDTKVDQSFAPDGSTNITYTARDFTSVKLSRGQDGSSTMVLKDRNGRPQLQEDVTADGERTVARLTYHDTDGKVSPWLRSREVTAADGTQTTTNYDKFGKIIQA